MSIARHHAEWLSLLEISGPFLSLPVLLRVFPQGLDEDDPNQRRELRLAYEEWLDNQFGLQPDPAIHRAWVRYVLTQTLQLPEEVLAEGQAIPPTLKATIAEHQETLRPDLAVLDPDDNQPRLLIQIVPAAQNLAKPLADHHWKASPEIRMMELLHASNVRLGLVTDGEQWLLVNAPRGETTGFISWYAELWLEEKITLRAFRSLLGVHRFFSVAEAETLETMLAQSQDEQHEVTDQLGYQVRRAVEVLVQAIDLADRDRATALKGSRGGLLADMSEAELYEAALTIMMRLVFLFSAEERGLFPLDDDLYNQYYAASTLRAQLREAADQFGEEVIERRLDAWCRLLTTFRAIHSGIEHDRLRLPAYGGSLFDPDRFPFLEGRPKSGSWLTTPADPLPINNRTVLHLLEALQLLQVRVPGGGPAEARRLSFRALDIEQIGHVYESLLDHTAVRAETLVLGLAGSKNQEPEILLATLESFLASPPVPPKGGADIPPSGGLGGPPSAALITFLHEQTGRGENALRKALVTPSQFTIQSQRPPMGYSQLLRAACGNDDALYQRVLPFAGLLREDDLGQPAVILPGSVYMTAGAQRRATGTHYTPRSLTEPIVQHTLEPLVYHGPAEGLPPEQWRLKTPADLLNLKICDMAMGSGAFLVQACRYMSERLVEAWETAEKGVGSRKYGVGKKKNGEKSPTAYSLLLTPEGEPTANPDLAIPPNTDERLIFARRLVADRCLYGVDKNPLAVEMAKLSLWLITLDKNRPFTFLDHALKCGDSLVGVNLDQLTTWSLEGRGERRFETMTIQAQIDRMVTLRRKLEAIPVNSMADQEHKRLLFEDAERIAYDLRRGGDMLIGSYFNTLSSDEQAYLRTALLLAFRDGQDVPPDRAKQADLGNLRPFHWPLEFPEVFLTERRSGFDAFVGNPPFMWGNRISSRLGVSYRNWLNILHPKALGNADLCTHFFLRTHTLAQQNGTIGLIATNSISETDNRVSALEPIVLSGTTIINALSDFLWPGAASLHVSVLVLKKGSFNGQVLLDNKPVNRVSVFLDSSIEDKTPKQLQMMAEFAFKGVDTGGLGFVISDEERELIYNQAPHSADLIWPFLNGEDFMSHPEQIASRLIINFSNMTLEQSYKHPLLMRIVEERVLPYRKSVNSEYNRENWWLYNRPRPALYSKISKLHQCIANCAHSKFIAFEFVNTRTVFSNALNIFTSSSISIFGVLQCTLHDIWARYYGSTLETRNRYNVTDVFEAFPFPDPEPSTRNPELETIGGAYHKHRRQIMLARQEGLTATYNRFHNPEETVADIAWLRELHVQMDQAVAAAYGWSDLALGHDFHDTAQGVRFTISESARREVLGRLLTLNHNRYEEEVRMGLHSKGKAKAKAEAKEKKQGTLRGGAEERGGDESVVQGRLFE